MTASERAAAAQTVAWDYVIVGAGTAGLPAAIFASRRGAKVLLIDAADQVGGTMHLANGQVAAAGTRTQAAKGITDDTRDKHYDDVMRITRGLADASIVRTTVDNAPATINWLLDNGLTPLPDHPVTGDSPGRPAYTTPRYIWGKGEGRDILKVVVKELEPELASGRVVTQLSTRVTGLLTAANGAVEGVRATSNGQELTFKGRHILITTGGYAMNPVLFERLIGNPTYAAGSYPQAQGDGLELATAVGGKLRGKELHRAGSGSILTTDKFPARPYARFITAPQERQPWEIWVNNAGQRFVCEDEPLTYNRERGLVALDKFRFAVVFDDGVFQNAPVAIAKWTRDQLAQHFNKHPMFHRADTLAELAAKAGVDAKGLEQSVRAYNESVKSGSDKFGRKHMPRALTQAPYYAVIHYGTSATSSIGIVVDKDLRVLRADGSVIPNLYAVGEVLGSGATLGNAFAPGMMLTPALTLGRLLGERLPIGA